MTQPAPERRSPSFTALLVKPLVAMETSAAERAQNIALTLLALLACSLPTAILYGITAEDISAELPFIVPAISTIFIAYALARFGKPDLGLWLTIIVTSAAALLLVQGEHPEVVLYLVIPLGFSSLFMDPRRVLIVAIGQGLGVVTALPLLFDAMALDDVMLAFGAFSLVGMLVILSSIVRHQTQIQQAHQIQQLSTLMEFMTDAVIIHQDGLIIDANAAARDMLGEDVVGREASSVLPATRRTTAERIKHGSGYVLVTSEQLFDKTGQRRDVQMTTHSFIRDDKLATQVVLSDRTHVHKLETEIAAAKSRYEVVVDLVTDMTYEMRRDENGVMRLWDVRGDIQGITGYTDAEFRTIMGSWQMVHPEDVPLVRQHIRMMLRGSTDIIEYRLIRKGGSICWIRDYARPRRNAQGYITGVEGVVQNVTERLEAEMALKRHAMQQAVVAELGQRAMRRPGDLSEIVEEAVMLVTQVLDVEYCRICDLNPQDPVLVFRAGVGWEGLLAMGEVFHVDTTTPQTRQCISRMEPVIVRNDPQRTRFGLEIVSGISVLLHGQEHVLGLLEIHSEFSRDFAIDDVNFLQSIANILAGFFEQQRTRSSETQQRETANALAEIASILNQSLDLDHVLDRMLDYLAEIVPHDTASIMLIEGDEARIIRHRGFEAFDVSDATLRELHFDIRDTSNLRSMLETGHGLVINDTLDAPRWRVIGPNEWIRSHIGAPIIVEGDCLGFINVDSARVGAFSQADMHRLEAFAHQAATAVRNARRADDLERSVQTRTSELDLERRRLQTILDGTGEGIIYSEGRTIRYANAALETMTGYPGNSLSGQPITRLLDDDGAQRWDAIADAARQDGVSRDEEMILCRQDGTTFDAGITVSLVDATPPLRLVTLVRDISRAKMFKEQQARFIANASHELRSPIAGLNTRIYLMRRTPERMEQHLVLLERITNRMNQLIEDLLDRSRLEHGVIPLRQRGVVLQSLLADVIELQRDEAEQKGLTLIDEITDVPLNVFVDPDRILQVLTNLISNAINYTEAGGTVTIRAQRSGDASHARIEVADTGIGISTDDLQHIFQPFFRGDNTARGTGLGLSITRQIVELHKGQISVQSTPGQGSVFTVDLPLLSTR